MLERYAKDPADLDAKAIGRIAAVARRWIDDSQPYRARQTVLALLKLPAALDDPAVHADLVAFLEEFSRAPAHLRSEPTTPAQRAAMHRWEEVIAA